MTTQPPTPPRVAHNAKLSVELCTALKIPARYPKVVDQLPTVPLDMSKLQPFGYNPTLAGMSLVYRYHDDGSQTKLAIAPFNPLGGPVMQNRLLNIPGKSIEDPRWFKHNKNEYLSFVDSDYPEKLTSVVKYGRFNGGEILDILTPPFPGNDRTTTQKNYLFFSTGNELYCIYRSSSIQQLYCSITPNFWNGPIESEGPSWPYGEPRGGCIIPWDGKLLRFFHSSLRNEFVGKPWRYYIGACVMEHEPPFKVIRTSKKPILYASEMDALKVKDRPAHWKSSIIFASGVIEYNGEWLLSCGINDSSMALVRVREENLNL